MELAQVICFLCMTVPTAVFAKDSCNNLVSEEEEDDSCFGISQQGGVPWHEFDWQSYIEKDWDAETDESDPLGRFGIHLRNSIDIGVNRTVPDNRPPECASVDWTLHGPLPDASVIITYRDEPRSTLLRTIVSVLERTPAALLREIILVDDNNLDPSVGEQLKHIHKVVVLRNDRREGLIRSRIKGTKAARGNVLVFLDSHCEAEPGWLEPLLSRIKENPKRLASPVIDNINLFQYHFEPVSTFLRGGFNWNLDFFWEYLPAYDRARRMRDPTYSYKTPAIAGGLFAIDRDWFTHLGAYDEGLEIWGGENIEFSLRVWTCGGEMEIVPCSKVGHIYKQRNVYSYPDGLEKTTVCNTRRVADAWMDQFKQIYERTLSKKNLEYDCGDVSAVKQKRRELGCKSFQWFIENVYPEIQVPLDGDKAFGGIHYDQSNGFLKCLDTVASGAELAIGGNSCLQTYYPQRFRLSKDGLIAQEDFCLSITEIKTGALVMSQLCDASVEEQRFIRRRPKSKKGLQGYQIKHEKHDLCLDVSSIKETGLRAFRCDSGSTSQRFLFDYDLEKA